jgi:acyl-CoA reductase-like NAD-dependent aldehyde dehydrogenase
MSYRSSIRNHNIDIGSLKTDATIEGISPSSKSEIDDALKLLQSKKERWLTLSIDEKIQILDEVLQDFNAIAEDMVEVSCQAKGSGSNNFAWGEEWFYVAFINRSIRLLRCSLYDIKFLGRPKIPGPIKVSPDGQVVVQVFPQTYIDRMLLRGTTAEVFIEPGVSPEDVVQTQALAYQLGSQEGKITLILGAGNTSFLVPGDFLSKLFVEGHVVALKPNPVNDYLGPFIEQGFRALIERGFMRVVYGGAQEGAYLCNHPLIDDLHMTGSHHTFEAIVFGTGKDGEQRKLHKQPILDKHFSAELGNITPLIIVPGDWSESDLRVQAEKIVTWLIYNAGYACPTPRLMIQSKNWNLRQELNQAIIEVFSEVETRNAYYPGSQEIHARFVSAHPNAHQLGEPAEGHLPWTFISGVDSNNLNDICFQEEAFCGLLSETAIEEDSVPRYLDRAVEFVNDHVWGTLNSIIIIHPKSLKDPAINAAFENAIANLHYGTVAINQYPAISYFLGFTTWGSFPGQDIYDIQSGIGFTNNYLMFERPQKSVMRAPFKFFPDPFTIRNKRAHEFGKKMAEFEVSPSLLKVPGIAWSVFRN